MLILIEEHKRPHELKPFDLSGVPAHAARIQMHHGRVSCQYVALRTARLN